jgi:ABC-type branched-subunit amino acid transport system substrate-binding protein
MAVDEGVLGVLVGWSPETAEAVVREYERLGLAFLSPQTDLTDGPAGLLADPEFVERYQALSGGVAPGEHAAWAYAAANQMLDAFEVAAWIEPGFFRKAPTRAGVQMALSFNHAQ